MRELAGDWLVENWPDAEDLAACHVVYMANIDAGLQETLTAQARAGKTLVNVEDVKPLCDFHVPALGARRLILTVSTGGKSPGCARPESEIEEQYPAAGPSGLTYCPTGGSGACGSADFSELIERTNQLIEAEGWLS